MRTHLAGQPQPGLDHHRQGHPHDAALGLDAYLIGLDLTQVSRVLHQMLLDRLWPWRPARTHHAVTVSSSHPKATTMACSGHPWASRVTTRLTVSAEVRRRYHAVPVVALNVLWHSVHRKRWSLHEWIRRLP
jgi:hypothetical protein